MIESAECPKGYRFSKAVISYTVYLYHRFLLSYRDVQELLFERGVDVSHETVSRSVASSRNLVRDASRAEESRETPVSKAHLRIASVLERMVKP